MHVLAARTIVFLDPHNRQLFWLTGSDRKLPLARTIGDALAAIRAASC